MKYVPSLDKNFYPLILKIREFKEKVAKSEEKIAQAKINMSQTTEINPFMLLMAHTIIRHVIEIDNNTTIGVTSHTDEE